MGSCLSGELRDNYPCEVRHQGKWYRATTESHTGSASDGTVQYQCWIRSLGQRITVGDRDIRGITTDTDSSDYADLVL